MIRQSGKLVFVFVGLLILGLTLSAQTTFTHPRGLLTRNELADVRKKVGVEPFHSMLKTLKEFTKRTEGQLFKTVTDSSALACRFARLYTLTGSQDQADSAWIYARGVLNNREIFNNPVSRGLNRAKLLRDMAETYDLCYSGWSEKQCRYASEKLFFAMMTTSSNMGYDANYSMESNWMGVRYGAVLLASLVNDDWQNTPPCDSRLLPFRYDASKRIFDHLELNINGNGWNTESLSYFVYDWTFIAPALIAWQNQVGSSVFELEKRLPKIVNSLWGFSTASVSIPGIGSSVMQPDFSDDDPMGSPFLYPVALRLFPQNQKPFLAWMQSYLTGLEVHQDNWDQLFYAILFTPADITPQNPADAGWLTYYDSDQGIALFRNRFKDSDDIVAGFTATSKRVNGHQSYDNLGFRILGLGSIWAVGAGRTDQIAGQTSLFPSKDIDRQEGERGALGKVSEIRFSADGSGFISASGSCMGVKNHERSFRVDYRKKSGAEAVIIVSDHSDNGRLWRMNSPEFNTLTLEANSFRLTSPEGNEMKAVVFTDKADPEISRSMIHYGGDTKDHNYGIAYKGKSYLLTHAIDCKTNGDITVVLTLVKKGEKHPVVLKDRTGNITVGGITYDYSPKKYE